MRTAALVLLLGAFAFGVAACGGSSSSSSSTGEEGGTTTIAGEPANDHGSEDVSGKQKIEVEADDFYFKPTVLNGTPGQKATIDIHNEGNASHTFTIDGQNVDVEVGPTEERDVEVTFPESGTLRFYCRFHEAQGMAGELEASGSGTSSGTTTDGDTSTGTTTGGGNSGSNGY
jgi:plastocyanin